MEQRTQVKPIILFHKLNTLSISQSTFSTVFYEVGGIFLYSHFHQADNTETIKNMKEIYFKHTMQFLKIRGVNYIEVPKWLTHTRPRQSVFASICIAFTFFGL